MSVCFVIVFSLYLFIGMVWLIDISSCTVVHRLRKMKDATGNKRKESYFVTKLCSSTDEEEEEIPRKRLRTGD